MKQRSNIQIKSLKSTTLRKQIVEIIIQEMFHDNLKTETTALEGTTYTYDYQPRRPTSNFSKATLHARRKRSNIFKMLQKIRMKCFIFSIILEGINHYRNARNQLILLSRALPKESREQTSDN